MEKDTKIALVFCAVFIGLLGLTVVFKNTSSNSPSDSEIVIENGRQVIDITAKGGYSPRFIRAKAGVPTDLRVLTNGTYDCSSSIAIPALGYQKMLKATGTEVISLSADQAQGTLTGTCSMGMYSFKIAFE